MALFIFGRITPKLLWSALFLVTTTNKVEANLVFTVAEVGSDVIISFSGSLNTAAAAPSTGTGSCSTNPQGSFNPFAVCIGDVGPVGAADSLQLFRITGPASIAWNPPPATFEAADLFSPGSDGALVNGNSGRTGVPVGYSSLSTISGSSVFVGETLASLGVGSTPAGNIGTWTLLDPSLSPLTGVGSTISINVSPAASASGDPHFKTWTGQRYDYHGECDLVLVSSSSFGNKLGLDIHIRTTIRDDWSFISAAALRIGQDILEVHSYGKYYLNGLENAPIPEQFAGFHFSLKNEKRRPDRFIVRTNHGKIEIRVYGDIVSVHIDKPTVEGFGDSIGLMGAFGSGAWLLRDGVTATEDANKFGSEWQVHADESKLFLQDGPVTHPQLCRLPGEVAKEGRRRLNESHITQEMAEAACKHWTEDKDICIEDVLRTGEIDFAVAGGVY